jgi:hypothetical protein
MSSIFALLKDLRQQLEALQVEFADHLFILHLYSRKMLDPNIIVSTLINGLKGQLAQSARELKMRDGWDLGCPVMVIGTRKAPVRVIVTTIRRVTGVITTSHVIDHPLMRAFRARHKEVGAGEEVSELINSPDGKRFAEEWDSYVNERDEKGLACWSHDDAAKFASKSREAIEDGCLACVAITEGDDGDGLGVLKFQVMSEWLMH